MKYKFSHRAVSVQHIQKLDKYAIEEIGIPSLCLMENAGRAVAQEVLNSWKGKRPPRVSIICGSGNNAGDGFAAARHLRNSGAKVKVFTIGAAQQLKQDAAIQYQILKRTDCPIKTMSAIDQGIAKELKASDRVIDAIFGVGLNREITEPYRNIILSLNALKKNVVSVDIPTGLDGTTGKILGVCVKARTTVTLTAAKKGFFKNLGPRYTGRIIVADIGIPKELITRV